MNRLLVSTLLVLAIAVLAIGAEACTRHNELPQKIEAILNQNSAALDRTTPGIYVQQRNKTSHTWADLYTMRHEEYHTPASNNKVLTTAAIISSLGPSYVIETPFFGTGKAPSEPLMCIKGMGDPSMTYASLQKAVKELKSRHVASIEQVILDDSLYDPSFPDGWEWGDLVYYYGAQPSSFILDENVVSFSVAPGFSVGDPLRVVSYSNSADSDLGIIDVSQSATSSASTSPSVDVAWRIASDKIYVIGSVPLGHDSISLQAAVPKPTARFAHFLRTALEEAGITMTNNFKVGSCAQFDFSLKPLFSLQSDTLGNMVNRTLQVSDNLMAEIWSRHLGYVKKAPGGSATSRGVQAVSDQLSGPLGVNAKSFRQRDGSGLDSANLVSPWALVNVVKAMGETPFASEYKSYLPNSFPGGKLYYRFANTPAVGRVFAKTGYISLVSSLSGWVDNDKLFSILLDQSPTPSSVRMTIINDLVVAIADLCPLH
jgi:D-alanyl-D-alanine carboxypeptidase/D-alanyl-D-alanine-endopeptidase (penicillin-binding protein 4)